LLARLYGEQRRAGWVTPGFADVLARELRLPVAEVWEAATSYADFRFVPPTGGEVRCAGLSCQLARGSFEEVPSDATHCLFRCYEAPATGAEEPFPAAMVRRAGPLLSPDITNGDRLSAARRLGRDAALEVVAESGLRGRGGAYFPVGTKWRAALDERRPIALVVNAEEGEPGVFKDRALLSLAPRRVVEGIAIAAFILEPAVIVVFANGHADPAVRSLEEALDRAAPQLDLAIVRGGGGYVLGEESALLNALEGRRPVPRTKPPYPVQSGLFGMPTVVNNIETFANLSVLFGDVPGFRARGTPETPGTKILSISGRVELPGAYELPVGVSLRTVVEQARPTVAGEVAVLAGGPSGGFLSAGHLDVPLQPGVLHATGAMLGAGGLVVLDAPGDIRDAALAMARFNAEESCGKCTPCREGTPRLHDLLAAGDVGGIEGLAEVVQFGSLCGLGQMAPGPVRSALHFWPEVFS
jgi:NADH:ubiquinone oxidoreductase subunit F (NADH-binding)